MEPTAVSIFHPVPETSTLTVPAASVAEAFTSVKESCVAPDFTVSEYTAPNPSVLEEVALDSLAPALTETFHPL